MIYIVLEMWICSTQPKYRDSATHVTNTLRDYLGCVPFMCVVLAAVSGLHIVLKYHGYMISLGIAVANSLTETIEGCKYFKS